MIVKSISYSVQEKLKSFIGVRGEGNIVWLAYLMIFLFIGNVVNAQVAFEDLSFEEAKSKAQVEGKIIFVDVMRGGMPVSAAVKKVEEEVFTLDSISAFFINNCVSIKMDMATDEGKAFAPNLNMLMYPAYVFYDAKGAQLQYTNAFSVQNNPGLLMQKARTSAEVAHVKRTNTRHIQFATGSWESILAEAKETGKMIFLDAQTEWCRPCRMMERDVFTLDRVADFYNDNFINVSMDMEKGNGPALAKKHQIRAYPTYLFIDADGNVVHRDEGYKEAERFIAVGQEALEKTQAGIQFREGSWNALLSQAKKENKLIFLDAYTVWCGPCKMMDREVFPNAEVGEYFNANFINVKRDMEKGEGLDLAKKYEVKAYPTFLFINGDGDEVYRIVGGSSAESFLSRAKIALDPSQHLNVMEARYLSGERSAALMNQYLDLLELSYNMEKAAQVASDYLSSLSPNDLKSAEHWNMARKFLNDPVSPVLLYYAKNRNWLAEEVGVTDVDRTISDLYAQGIYRLYSAQGSSGSQRKKLKAVEKNLKKAKLPQTEELKRLGQIQEAIRVQNWKELASILNGVAIRGDIVYNQSLPTSLGQYVPTLLKATGSKYVEQAQKWSDTLLSKLDNLLDQSKVWDIKALAYTQIGDADSAENAEAKSKALVNKWQESNKGSGMMMAIPMKLQ